MSFDADGTNLRLKSSNDKKNLCKKVSERNSKMTTPYRRDYVGIFSSRKQRRTTTNKREVSTSFFKLHNYNCQVGIHQNVKLSGHF